MRKVIKDIGAELVTWLSNYDSGEDTYPDLVFRLLASAPGGERAEDLGFERFEGVGWHELDQLGRMLDAIETQRDVEDLLKILGAEDEE